MTRKSNQNNKPILNQETLSTLNNTLSQSGTKFNIDNTDTSSIISGLVSAVLFLSKKVDMLESSSTSGSLPGSPAGPSRIREAEDELDEVKQRSLKGNLILTSPSNIQQGLTSLFMSDTELQANNITFTGHVVDLIRQKYGVVVPEQDIQACHRLPNGSIVLRIWNRKPGSAWSALLTAIKSGSGDRKLNVFLNFHLTHRRNKLMYELRQLKKKKVIAKYYSDENGCLSFKMREADPKKKITFHRVSLDGSPVLTATIAELQRMVET